MRPSPDRNGSAAVAMLVVLAMLQIIVAAMVVSGARSNDLAVLRLDTARALYAAEAGANMAIRELMLELDEDEDGVIGSISDDGNPGNDPSLGPARITSTAVSAGGGVTITISGRSGAAVRRVEIVVE